MAEQAKQPKRRRGRGIRPWLLTAKLLGVIVFVGGIAAAAGLTCGARQPPDRTTWLHLSASVSRILVPGTFGGATVAIGAGLCLWLQMPRTFLRMRWFRLKVVLIVAAIPVLHLWGRFTALKLHAALEEGARLEEVAALWDRLSLVLLLAFAAMAAIAWAGRVKPRLGQPFAGARSVQRLKRGSSVG